MATLKKELTQVEKNKIKFRLHTTALDQIFLTMFQASSHDKKTNIFQPEKLNIRKSTHGASSAMESTDKL